MKLIFEIGSEGRKLSLLPECDVPETAVPEKLKRRSELHLPHLSENEISRHYTKASPGFILCRGRTRYRAAWKSSRPFPIPCAKLPEWTPSRCSRQPALTVSSQDCC